MANNIVRGSLPCGNPKRYTTADVVQMRADERKKISCGTQDSSEGTESDQYLQTLLKRQIGTDITLKQQFSQHRNFTESSSHAPSVNKLDGLHSVDEHLRLDEFDSRIDYLKSCGLTREEITFKLKQDLPNKNAGRRGDGFGADPVSEKILLEEIEKKLSAKEEALKKPDQFNGGLELSRQALMLEKSTLERQNKEAFLPEFLFKQKKFDNDHPDDPINHIPEILSDIEPRPTREPRRERRRKRKLHQKLLRQQVYFGIDNDPKAHNEFMESVGLALKSTDDSIGESVIDKDSEMKNLITDIVLTPDYDNNERVSSDHEDVSHVIKKKKTISAKPSHTFNISEFTHNVPLVTDEEIASNRLSLQEILNMDKFQNYEQGNPNKTVFVKNLPYNITEMDMVSLFCRFQHHDTPSISFRLLNGRMKGQAFITFPDANTAREAINKLNGFKLRAKPIIMSFGKKQDSEDTKTSSKYIVDEQNKAWKY